jgi:uncharacterized membrane protein (DUF4010 family)
MIIRQLAIALGLGLLIGLQREWATTRIAGIRTFPLITLLGLLSGVLAANLGVWVVAAALLALAITIMVGNVGRYLEGHPDGGITTETASLVMFVVGALLAFDHTEVAIVTTGVVAALLYWKQPLHAFVQRIGEADFRALIQLVVIALVILPVLPDRAYGPHGVLNPFRIWLMVVLIVGISMAAYVAYKLLGPKTGTLAAGVLGGLISSTAATLSFARLGRRAAPAGAAAAVAIMIASTVVFGRVLFEIAVIAPNTLSRMGPPLLAMMGAMIAIAAGLWTRSRHGTALVLEEDAPPSSIRSAILFALLYAVVLFGVAVANEQFGREGLFAVAGISGLTDMDAITLSTAQLVGSGALEAGTGWRLILVGGMANLVFKGGVVAVLGSRKTFRLVAAAFGLSLAVGAALIWLWP